MLCLCTNDKSSLQSISTEVIYSQISSTNVISGWYMKFLSKYRSLRKTVPDKKRSTCNSFPNLSERFNLVHEDKNIKGGHGDETGEGIIVETCIWVPLLPFNRHISMGFTHLNFSFLICKIFIITASVLHGS